MSALFLQLQTLVQAESEIPDAKWFATIDASQVKRGLPINWQDLAIEQHWKNVLQGTSEGLEADLTCWLAPLTEDTLQFTLDLSKTTPFCCTWLQSNWSIDDIVACWQKSANPQLPDGHHGLLRFYDACILGPLQATLTPDQWKTLTAPLLQWSYIARNGVLANIQSPVQAVTKNGKLSLSKNQLKQLQLAGQTDNIIFHMQNNDHLPDGHDPFATYRQIDTALALLNKHKLIKSQDHYLFSVLTLAWPLAHFADPGLEQTLVKYKSDETTLGVLVEQHSPKDNNAAI